MKIPRLITWSEFEASIKNRMMDPAHPSHNISAERNRKKNLKLELATITNQ